MYTIGTRELNAVQRVFDTKHFFRYGGRETAAAEQAWAEKIGVKTAYAVTSGTSALITALQAMGVGPGQSVLVPGYTFISTALAVTAVGAIPIYTEIDESLTICPDDIEKKIRRHTSCIIPVHMQGMPCRMDRICRIAAKHGIRVLEDACQAAGGSFRDRRLGAWGDMGAFSFNQYKIISCGEGGAVVTSNPRLAERAYMSQDGSCSVWPETGEMSEAFYCGGNFRFNDLNAAILRVQVDRLDGILSRLRAIRQHFQQELTLPQGSRLVTTHDEAGNCGVCFLIRADSDALAITIEAAARAAGLSVHRPINSGRHVYSAWDVINSKLGGHHPDWDCFRHPKNRRIATNYHQPMRTTDTHLRQTVLCAVPYDWTQAQQNRCLRQLRQAWS